MNNKLINEMRGRRQHHSGPTLAQQLTCVLAHAAGSEVAGLSARRDGMYNVGRNDGGGTDFLFVCLSYI